MNGRPNCIVKVAFSDSFLLGSEHCLPEETQRKDTVDREERMVNIHRDFLWLVSNTNSCAQFSDVKAASMCVS